MTLHSDSERKARMQWGFWRIWEAIKAVRDSAFFSPLSAPSSMCLILLLSLFLSLHNCPQPWNMSITTWILWKEALLEVWFQVPQCVAEFLSGSIRCPFLAENLPRGMKASAEPHLTKWLGDLPWKGRGKAMRVPNCSIFECRATLLISKRGAICVLLCSESVFFFISPQEKYPSKYSQKGYSWSPKLCIHFQNFNLGVFAIWCNDQNHVDLSTDPEIPITGCVSKDGRQPPLTSVSDLKNGG